MRAASTRTARTPRRIPEPISAGGGPRYPGRAIEAGQHHFDIRQPLAERAHDLRDRAAQKLFWSTTATKQLSRRKSMKVDAMPVSLESGSGRCRSWITRAGQSSKEPRSATSVTVAAFCSPSRGARQRCRASRSTCAKAAALPSSARCMPPSTKPPSAHSARPGIKPRCGCRSGDGRSGIRRAIRCSARAGLDLIAACHDNGSRVLDTRAQPIAQRYAAGNGVASRAGAA